MLPLPLYIEEDKSLISTIREHPLIVNSLHPFINMSISELDVKNDNLIFNDLIQESFFNKNEKLLGLVKSFLSAANTYPKLIQNLIKVYTHESGFFGIINKALREENPSTFLGSAIYLLNDAIRTNFSDLRYEKKCFRKANLRQEEFDGYFNIFQNTQNRIFCWKSFVSGTKAIHSDLKNNVNSSIYENTDYNTIFTIEFVSDSWGLDISGLSLSKYDDEVLLPANSLFEITNIFRDDKDQIIHIHLFKLDKNIKSKPVPLVHASNPSVARAVRSSTLEKASTIIEKEITLLNFDVMVNNHKYQFLRDDENTFKIKFALNGPQGSPYQAGVFQVNVFIPDGYPNDAPIVKFATKIYHPNISFDSGALDTETMKKFWRPSMSVADLINKIYDLLASPDANIESYNTPQKKEFFDNKEKFAYKALEMTKRFADFSIKINNMQTKNKINEAAAKLELLRLNSFESQI